jgi:hypothetical protein
VVKNGEVGIKDQIKVGDNQSSIVVGVNNKAQDGIKTHKTVMGGVKVSSKDGDRMHSKAGDRMHSKAGDRMHSKVGDRISSRVEDGTTKISKVVMAGIPINNQGNQDGITKLKELKTFLEII